MKKSIIALMGLFTLVACSEDAFQDAETLNEEAGFQNQANSFNDNDSGFVNGPGGIKAPGKNYFSPWDIWFNRGYDDQQPSYYFNNGNVENISPYTLEVYAWVGLAYFDGTNDGSLSYDVTQPSFTPNAPGGLTVNMAASPTFYTNLYANNQEVGNLVRVPVPIVLNPLDELRFEDKLHHFPTTNSTNIKYSSPVFNFAGTISPQEETLLNDYGKVFFYEVRVFEAGAFIGQYVMHPEINTLPNFTSDGYWKPVMNNVGTTQLQGNMPLLGSPFPLFYIDHPNEVKTIWDPDYVFGSSPSNNRCDSHEVVFYLPASMQLSAQTITGGSVPKTLGMGFHAHPFTLWQNCSLHLTVY